ncbi:hypothetical protein GBF38_013773, partial [Nibea albiflora]
QLQLNVNDVSVRSASGAGLMIVGDDGFQTDPITSKTISDKPPQGLANPLPGHGGEIAGFFFKALCWLDFKVSGIQRLEEVGENEVHCKPAMGSTSASFPPCGDLRGPEGKRSLKMSRR